MTKKISMNKLDKVIQAGGGVHVATVTFEADGEEILVEVRHVIPADDMTEFVCSVTANLFHTAEDGTVVYMPERYGIAMAAAVLGYYTNFKVGIPDDKLTTIVYGSELMPRIQEYISKTQLDSLADAVDRRVNYICNVIKSSYEDKIARAVEQIEAAGNAFHVLSEQFSDFGQDKMTAVMENLAKMSPDALVEAVGNAGT